MRICTKAEDGGFTRLVAIAGRVGQPPGFELRHASPRLAGNNRNRRLLDRTDGRRRRVTHLPTYLSFLILWINTVQTKTQMRTWCGRGELVSYRF